MNNMPALQQMASDAGPAIIPVDSQQHVSPVVDAIVVPTIRPTTFLTSAVELARQTNTYLLLLCSSTASALEARTLLAENNCRGTALAISAHYSHSFFGGFATGEFLESKHARMGDTSTKRNIGLAIARMVGWERLLFLDDDITGLKAEDVQRASALLPEYPAVGFKVVDFPDNSVVYHALRLAGTEPGVQLSSGALVVNTKESFGFFPEIYNEDWFFLFHYPSAGCGGVARQYAYDPFSNPMRARREEFGDVLAAGIMEMRTGGLDCYDASEADWAAIIAKRRQLIDDVQRGVAAAPQVADTAKEVVQRALQAAKVRNVTIQAATCRAYVQAWRQDAAVWQHRLDTMPYDLSLIEALNELKLT